MKLSDFPKALRADGQFPAGGDEAEAVERDGMMLAVSSLQAG